MISHVNIYQSDLQPFQNVGRLDSLIIGVRLLEEMFIQMICETFRSF